MQTLGLWTGNGGILYSQHSEGGSEVQGKMRTSIVISLNDISNVFYPFSVRAFSHPECSVRWSFLVLGIHPHIRALHLCFLTVLSGTAFLSFVPHLLSLPFVLIRTLKPVVRTHSLCFPSYHSWALWLKVQNTCVEWLLRQYMTMCIMEHVYSFYENSKKCIANKELTTCSLLLTTHLMYFSCHKFFI